jgi:hypothetical protein
MGDVLPIAKVVSPAERTWDSGYIGFRNGTALGGNCQVYANSNGDWTFKGHMHGSTVDTCYGVAALLLTPSGVGYTFIYRSSAEGSSAGLLSGGCCDDDWISSGSTPSLRDNWFQAVQSVFRAQVTSQDELAAGMSALVQSALEELAQEGITVSLEVLIALV